MTKGFYITVTNNLLDPKHCQAMGSSIWLFLWFIDKMTKIDTEKGIGKVLGGKPIKYEEVEKDLGISRGIYTKYITILKKNHYIQSKRTPYGYIIIVNKAKKVFKRDVRKSSISSREMSENPVSNKMSENPVSNKTIQYKDNDYINNNTIHSKSKDLQRFNKNIYSDITNEYQHLKGITLQGKEFSAPQKYIKDMLLSDRTPDQIKACMKWLAGGSEDWMKNWVMATVAKKMPEYIKKENQKNRPVDRYHRKYMLDVNNCDYKGSFESWLYEYKKNGGI